MKINLTVVITLVLMSFSVYANDTSNIDLKLPMNLSKTSVSGAVGEANNYEIHSVRVDRSGLGHVTFRTELIGRVLCNANYKKMLSFNTNTEGGKSVYSLVLSAYLSGKKIVARGTGTCSDYSVMESWNWGTMVD